MSEFETLIEEWASKNNKYSIYITKTDDSSKYIVFSKGSIRGFNVTFEKKLMFKKLNLRINACASFIDWETLYNFIEFFRGKYRVRLFEEGVLQKPADITNLHFINHAKSEASMMSNLFEKLLENQDYIKLPVWDFDLVIHRNDYDKFKKQQNFIDAISDFLQEKSYRLMHSRRAEIIKVDSGSLISVWNFDDALIESVNYIALSNPSGEDGSIFIKWEDFIHSSFVRLDTIPRDNGQVPYYFIYGIDVKTSFDAFESFKVITVDMSKL
jgi:hypothetical protein